MTGITIFKLSIFQVIMFIVCKLFQIFFFTVMYLMVLFLFQYYSFIRVCFVLTFWVFKEPSKTLSTSHGIRQMMGLPSQDIQPRLTCINYPTSRGLITFSAEIPTRKYKDSRLSLSLWQKINIHFDKRCGKNRDFNYLGVIFW